MKPSVVAGSASFVLVAVALFLGAGRAMAPMGRFTVDDPIKDVVKDQVTNLQWQRVADPMTRTWTDAMKCTTANQLLGGGGWRLPSVKELQTIVDESVAGPSIDAAAFPNSPAGIYWTSSPVAGDPSKAWYVSFSSGYTDVGGLVGPFRVRCVR